MLPWRHFTDQAACSVSRMFYRLIQLTRLAREGTTRYWLKLLENPWILVEVECIRCARKIHTQTNSRPSGLKLNQCSKSAEEGTGRQGHLSPFRRQLYRCLIKLASLYIHLLDKIGLDMGTVLSTRYSRPDKGLPQIRADDGLAGRAEACLLPTGAC